MRQALYRSVTVLMAFDSSFEVRADQYRKVFFVTEFNLLNAPVGVGTDGDVIVCARMGGDTFVRYQIGEDLPSWVICFATASGEPIVIDDAPAGTLFGMQTADTFFLVITRSESGVITRHIYAIGFSTGRLFDVAVQTDAAPNWISTQKRCLALFVLDGERKYWRGARDGYIAGNIYFPEFSTVSSISTFAIDDAIGVIVAGRNLAGALSHGMYTIDDVVSDDMRVTGATATFRGELSDVHTLLPLIDTVLITASRARDYSAVLAWAQTGASAVL
jgi:hypothetical protein